MRAAVHDAFGRARTDLDGVDNDFSDNLDIRRNFTGRVLRIQRDGSIPRDNPWLSRATVLPETFAHGLKDPEGAALHPQTGELWSIDHGPQGGDEINVIRGGRDYGWPAVTYGTHIHLGQYTLPTATRGLAGVVTSPIPVFWGIEKK